MSDTDFLKKIAELWLELGGDSEGVLWSWRELHNVVKQLEDERKEGDNSNDD